MPDRGVMCTYMPRPLPEPGSPEAAFYARMANDPGDETVPLILADLRGEAQERSTEEVLRGIAELRSRYGSTYPSPPHLAMLRGYDLDDEDCARLAPHLRGLLAAPPNTVTQAILAHIERRLSALFGAPDPKRETPDLRTPEGLRSQYDFQRALLASLNLLDEQGEQLGITGIDGLFHPLPSLKAIHSRLTSPDLCRKMEQGCGLSNARESWIFCSLTGAGGRKSRPRSLGERRRLSFNQW